MTRLRAMHGAAHDGLKEILTTLEIATSS